MSKRQACRNVSEWRRRRTYSVSLYLVIWKSHKSSSFSALAKLFLINNFHLQKISSQRKVSRYSTLSLLLGFPSLHHMALICCIYSCFRLIYERFAIELRVTSASKVEHFVSRFWKKPKSIRSEVQAK